MDEPPRRLQGRRPGGIWTLRQLGCQWEHEGRQPEASSQGVREDREVPQREVATTTYRINKIVWRSAPSGNVAVEMQAALPFSSSVSSLFLNTKIFPLPTIRPYF